jgi:hypothetical protein
MQKINKKLSIAKETIRSLDVLHLRGVAGGQSMLTCSDLCPDSDAGCIDTKFVHGCVSPSKNCDPTLGC